MNCDKKDDNPLSTLKPDRLLGQPTTLPWLASVMETQINADEHRWTWIRTPIYLCSPVSICGL